MSSPEKKDEKKERPLGPDGKPIPGPEQMRQIQAARKMATQQAQVNEVIGIVGQTLRTCKFLHFAIIFNKLETGGFGNAIGLF
jgi:hypothetical protein